MLVSGEVNRENRKILGEAKWADRLPLSLVDKADVLRELAAARQRLGSDVAVAEKLGLRASGHVPEMLAKIEHPEKFNPHSETCIRIAELIARSPSDVLRAVGLADVARIVEDHYGPPLAKPKSSGMLMSGEDQALLADWHALNSAQLKDPLRALIRELAASIRARPRGRKPPAERPAAAATTRMSKLSKNLEALGRTAANHPARDTGTDQRRPPKKHRP